MPTRLDVFTPASGFGEAIREARLDLNLTLTQFARKVGVSRQTLWSWECGHTLPRPQLLDRLAEVTGMQFNVRVERVLAYRWHCDVCGQHGPLLYGDDAKQLVEAEGARHSSRHGQT